MENKIEQESIADEMIVSRIFLIRGQKVMIDRDLAELYGVETKVLNQAVRRNIERFPEDFMFQLSDDELKNWKSQIVTSNSVKIGLRKKPLAFTEQGLAMLSSVLNSKVAIQVNIQIIRLFTKMREMLLTHKDLLLKIEQLERQTDKNTEDIQSVFKYLKQMLLPVEQVNRQRIGFKREAEGD